VMATYLFASAFALVARIVLGWADAPFLIGCLIAGTVIGAVEYYYLQMRIVDVAVEEFPAEVPRRDRRYGARSAGAPATAAGSSDRLQNLGEVTAPASSAHLLILKGK
jgi:hypothetical protein